MAPLTGDINGHCRFDYRDKHWSNGLAGVVPRASQRQSFPAGGKSGMGPKSEKESKEGLLQAAAFGLNRREPLTRTKSQ